MGKMITEISAFLVATAGWVLVSSTLPTDYWKVSSNDGTVITTATFWCNLWKICVTDSTGVSNCKDFPSMLALDGYIQVCRGLMISAVCLGFFATACALVGMKCTKIGGSDQLKSRLACFSGVQYFIAVSCTVGMDYWRISYIGGQGGSWIIKAAWYWSTLWRECYIDSSNVANCRDYDTMWVVRPASRTEQGPIQAVRALLIVGMFLGLFAAIFSFIGMDCTYIGGREKSKYKILVLGTVLHFAGGVTCLAAYCLYTSRLGTVVFTRMHDARLLRYYIGLPVFFGLVGSPCIILGSVLYAVTLYSVLTANRKTDVYASRKYMAPKIYKAQKKGRTSHNRDDASRSSSESSSQVSRTSLILADRDTFV
ncbi:claudin-10 isoform X3 [Ictalurus punctatus]|uniref:Claudin-10 isoform X3 n=1 Tax=Ictalurus punctatus TaxID=7998 RepID=A0A9F7TL47_ICTPU|nr:claudin-10 isoform X3 [Ictalurus punctatus]